MTSAQALAEPYVQRQLLPDFPLWDRLRDARVPVQFTLEVTARCTHDCRHCYINRPAHDAAAQAQELTLAEITALAADAKHLGALWCVLTGGDPLLREDFIDLYLALKRQGLLVSLFTNACLITPAHVELFRRYPPRDLEITVYGATAETYARVTGRPGAYAAFRRGLQLLRDGGIRVRLKAMALRTNVQELPAIADFCRAHTDEFFRFDPVLHLRYDGDPVRNAMIREERLTPAEIADLDGRDARRDDAVRALCAQQPAALAPIADTPLLSCGAGRMLFAIGPDGTFRLCPSLCHPECVYDLRRGSLTDAWQRFAPTVLARRAAQPAHTAACYGCGIRNLCLWCPAHAHLECGELEAPCAYFCAVAQARAARVR